MFAAQSLIKGVIARLLPSAFIDDRDSDKPVRLGRYGEMCVLSMVQKAHMLAEEGSYFAVNNAQTGLPVSTAVAFAATTPIAVVSNVDVPGPFAKNIYLDYAGLVTTVAGVITGGVSLQFALVLDNGDRYLSGGADLSPNIVTPNMGIAAVKSVAKVRFGNITAAAASNSVRTVVGLRILRPTASATVADVVGETKFLNFGGVEAAINGSIVAASPNNIPQPLPPIVIGPQTCALLYMWVSGTTVTTAPSYAPEFGWWER